VSEHHEQHVTLHNRCGLTRALLQTNTCRLNGPALRSFFHSLGASYVTDTSFSRELALLAAQREFVASYRQATATMARSEGTAERPPAPPRRRGSGMIIGCDEELGGGGPSRVGIGVRTAAQQEEEDEDLSAGAEDLPMLPVLASACPGWVCYAEKSHPKTLRHISRVRSPMGLMGGLVKKHLAARLGVSPAELYHVSVMPCFDKKLEASVRGMNCVPLSENSVQTHNHVTPWRLQRVAGAVLVLLLLLSFSSVACNARMYER
jgi:iron only hydrogenase large subunit-like protein